MRYIRWSAVIAMLLASSAMAQKLVVSKQVLTTPHYVVTITSHCSEGDVTCGGYEEYDGVSKKTQAAIHLKGEDVIHYCPDDQGDGPGKTPCHHVGFKFLKGDVTYFVSDGGMLQVTRGTSTLLQEQGKWDGE